MTPTEYRILIADRGLTQGGAAAFFGVSDVTGRRWAGMTGDGPPEAVAKFLRYMVVQNIKPASVDRAIARSIIGRKLAYKETI